MLPSFSDKFKFKKTTKYSNKIDWDEVQLSFKPDRYDVPLPVWMDGTIKGSDGHEVIHGTNYDEEIIGYRGSDLIFGHDGNDVIYGDQLSTRLNPDAGVDTVYGGNGNDRIAAEYSYGQNGNDILNAPIREAAYLNGGAGDDRLVGDSEDDELIGGTGDDNLRGKGGNDRYIGGRGEDTFTVGHGRSLEDTDVIVDFRDRGDKILIDTVSYRGLERENVSLDLTSDGILYISVHDPSVESSSLIAEVHGLDSRIALDQQIEWFGDSQIELIA